MSCPRSDHGQTLCNVVDHPDRPNETFCATCQRRFIKREYGFELTLLLMLVTSFFLVTAGNRAPRIRTASWGENDLPPLPEDVAVAYQQPVASEPIRVTLPPM